MRQITLVLLLFLLASCGQPLVTTTPPPSRPLGQRTPRTTSIVPTHATAAVEEKTPTEVPVPSVEPTAVPTPTIVLPTPSPTPAVIITPQTVPQTNEQRWRAQELNRQVFDPPRLYVAQSPVSLLWYDPVTGQTLEIGTLIGTFPVQAQFTLREGNHPAFEVPYRINGDFGLTAISDAVKQRMNAAGYTESVEAFVLQSDAIQPK